MALISTLVGTPKFVYDSYRNGVYTITNINAVGNTPPIKALGFVIGSWQVVGLAGAGTSVTAQLVGSNDNVNFFPLIATATSTDGIVGLTTQTTGTANIVPLYYSWLTAGTFTGSFTIVAALMSTFG